MKSSGRFAAVIMVVAAMSLPIVTVAQEKPKPKPIMPSDRVKPDSLYKRLGGFDTIARIVDTFLPKLLEEPKIAAMIGGLAQTSRNRNRQFIVDQICELTGGPCVYVGRAMDAAHQGLGIDDELWKFSQRKFAETLDELKIKNPERQELIDTIEKLRPDIVEKKK